MVRRGAWLRCVLSVSSLLVAGCGDDTGDPPNSGGPDCPNDDTLVVKLRDVSPTAGSSVPNGPIEHTFTTGEIDAHFDRLAFATLPSHTAGKVPSGTTFDVTPIEPEDGTGHDFVYTFTLTWPMAGHVAMADSALYADPTTGCKVALPTPLFEYDIEP